MGVQIRYMGAKHDLAPLVADVVTDRRGGPFLDLFSGMCSVAGAVADTGRPAWCNDVQAYAALVAKALVMSSDGPPSGPAATEALFEPFKKNLNALQDRFGGALEAEDTALASETHHAAQAAQEAWRHVGNDDDLAKEAARLRRGLEAFPYRLAALTYAHGYFGLRQALHIDSLRYAIDFSEETGRVSPDQARWFMVALLQTASHLSAAPGHFAEFLHVRDQTTFKRLRRLRQRSVWSQFHTELSRIAPYGDRRWRSDNHVFQSDAAQLPALLSERNLRPHVIYADPPYSKAQYSRYYHVLETIATYDYPLATGAGRYRDGRFTTPFSNVSTVVSAFKSMIANGATVGASFILSYPSNGLLLQVGSHPETLLREAYRSVSTVATVSKQHSTMGAAPGRRTNVVEELIFLAEGAR